MAASEAASPPVSVEMMMGAAGLTGFEPCVWGDFFITLAPPFSQVITPKRHRYYVSICYYIICGCES